MGVAGVRLAGLKTSGCAELNCAKLPHNQSMKDVTKLVELFPGVHTLTVFQGLFEFSQFSGVRWLKDAHIYQVKICHCSDAEEVICSVSYTLSAHVY